MGDTNVLNAPLFAPKPGAVVTQDLAAPPVQRGGSGGGGAPSPVTIDNAGNPAVRIVHSPRQWRGKVIQVLNVPIYNANNNLPLNIEGTSLCILDFDTASGLAKCKLRFNDPSGPMMPFRLLQSVNGYPFAAGMVYLTTAATSGIGGDPADKLVIAYWTDTPDDSIQIL